MHMGSAYPPEHRQNSPSRPCLATILFQAMLHESRSSGNRGIAWAPSHRVSLAGPVFFMEELLTNVLMIFGLGVLVLLLCHRLRLATTVGLLLTGILAGPNGLGWIQETHDVEILAEVGVVLLLFTIGMEFSLENLLRIKRAVLLGGGLQVLLTTLGGWAVSMGFGLGPAPSLFVGFLVSLSSTAIVLKILQQNAAVESPQGQTGLAILIFQDVAVIPMMLLLPLLAGVPAGEGQEPLWGLAIKALLFAGLMLAAAKWGVPYLLFLIARTRSRELFLFSILVLCFAIATLAQRLGLSLALGAFLAGLIVSGTEFSHESLGQVIPFRDVFTSLFFVSIGMLLDTRFLWENPLTVLFITLGVLTLKTLTGVGAVRLLGFPLRTAVLTGISLCQIGEFSFILFMKGSEVALLDKGFYQLFLTVAVLTMGVTPFAMSLAPALADRAMRLPLPGRLKQGRDLDRVWKGTGPEGGRIDHLVIVGYGLNGKNIARAAQVAGIPYVILEMNPRTVREKQKEGLPVFFGDASQEAVLEKAAIKEARVLVIVISDPMAVRRITAASRRENPKLHIIVRTRFLSEMKELLSLGADQVIPEEFETSIEIFSRVLARYLIPRNEVERLVAEARAGGYEMLRSLSTATPTSLGDLGSLIQGIDVTTFRLPEGSPLAGRTLAEMELRKRFGITVLAIVRSGGVLSNPDPHTAMAVRDILVVLARPEALAEHCSLFLSKEGGIDTACPV